MKSKLLIILAAVAALAVFSGCSSLDKKLQKLDALGITELSIPGRVTNTDYKRTEEGGQITSTLEHSNPWLIKPARVTRKRPAQKSE
jgi:hypothetical protein